MFEHNVLKYICLFIILDLENRHVGFHLHTKVSEPRPTLTVSHRVIHTDLQVVCWKSKLRL